MRLGFKFRLSSFWVGAHWSPYYKRLCINLLPGCTVHLTLKGGMTPEEAKAETMRLKVAASYRELSNG